MKKLSAVILSIILMISSLSTFADEREVSGLSEKLDALCIRKVFSQEKLNEILKNWEDDSRNYMNKIIEENGADGLSLLKKPYWQELEDKSPDECIDYIIKLTQPDFNNGFLMTCLNSINYSKQYAESQNFDYLFSNKKYWNIARNNTDIASVRLTINGDVLNYFDEFKNVYGMSSFLYSDTIELLNNKEKISKMLLEKNETVVDDIKLFNIYSISFLYIKCKSNEYMIDIQKTNSDALSEINPFKIYTSAEMAKSIDAWRFETTPVKPTYDMEATALQEQGLLNGNENGLDLLKPLTRAEAAAMLIRAIGQTEATPDNTIQTFSDVPTTFWGYGATERAYSLGIINGVGNNLFKPNDNVTAKQFSTMVLRSANEPEFDWQEAVNILIEKGIITEEESSTMDFFTRGDMAKIIYEARAKGLF